MTESAANLYDRMLILRCQTGDEWALAELISRYSPGLRFFLAKLTAESLADDLLQETWIDVYRKINHLQNPAAFPAWLYRIARDKAYRQLRRKPIAMESVDENVASSIVDEDEAFTPEDAEAVRVALDRLPMHQREILVLRFIDELTYEQIAEIIAIPLGTVRSRLHHAKLALRSKLEWTPMQKEIHHD